MINLFNLKLININLVKIKLIIELLEVIKL